MFLTKREWNRQSVHAAIGAHRTIRGRRKAAAFLDSLYGPTVRYGPPEPLPAGVARELRLAAESRNAIAAKARRERVARQGFWYARLLQAQQNRCYICAEPFTDALPPTKDHVWPQSRGGKNHRNILWACFPCNGAKSDRVPTEAEMMKLREMNALVDEMPSRTFDRIDRLRVVK